MKAGCFVAGISISSPVCGLRPFLAERSLTSKFPKPINWTFSPLARVSSMFCNTAFTAFSASFLLNSADSATALIKSVLFICKTS
ncbi:hypothetical protein BSG1_16325 [Bacillus sp. SG-1]|nr:hypothetical protein BSG1_16325 [Bacillus sp. SG-1]